MPRTQDKRIELITGEPGEWFVYLKPGYALDRTHCFGEDAKGDIRRTMTQVQPCNCDECRKLLTS